MIRTALTADAIAVAAELAALDGADGGVGAVVSFAGHVRADDGVTALWLEHHPRMTAAALDALAAEAMARWPLAAAVLIHRVGLVPLGACIVLVAVASPHRDAAFDAARYLIDRLKTDVPLWKRETLADGSTRWVAQKAADVARAGDWAG
jgi:molybdopterin synthase catalytic subunit